MQPEVYRMLYIVKTNDQRHASVADLIFDGARPFAVLSWSSEKDRRYPLVAVPLDMTDLLRIHGDEADYVYCRALDDPDA